MQPARLALTTAAQHFVSSDGQLLVDMPQGSVDPAGLAPFPGGVFLYLTQVKPGSGSTNGGSGQISFGTYEFQFFDGNGKQVSSLHLLHPFTMHFHLRNDQKELVWKSQKVYTIWRTVNGSSAPPLVSTQQSANAQAVQKAIAPQALANQKPNLAFAQSDRSGLDWSIQSTFSAPATNTGTPGKTAQANGSLVAQASSVSFNTQAPQATWGTPADFQVGLNSGGLNDNYPLNIPPGPGGFQPSLALNYSSGAVNENHNWQSAAPWVGQGWSLDLGSISWGEENVTPNSTARMESVWHISDPSGIGGQLIPPDLTYSTKNSSLNPSLSQLQSSTVYLWHVASNPHVKVREVAFSPANCWQVYLPNGTREDFGCTNDSRESYQDSSGNWDAYSWKLDLLIDRYGNQVHISYQQDFPSGYVRDSAIKDITYDDPGCHNTSSACSTWNPKVDIHFDASQKVSNLLNGGCGSGDSTTRCDDPLDLSGSGGLPAPKVMGAYVLNDVQVQVQGNLLHEYVFSYNQGGPQTITDPTTALQESVAGYLTLGKIQEEGTNGTSLNAPVITASYSPQTQHYSDLFSYSDNNAGDICSPYANAPRSGGFCYLWAQSFNQYYLSNLDNGRGWNESISWKEAHSNTWGTDGGSAVNNAFQCSSSQTSTNVCGQADDKNWSRIVVASRTANTNGVSSTWNYTYYLTTGVGASIPGRETRSCSGTCATYDWGNQNDDDYADYYNGDFQSFAQVQVTLPDGSSQTDSYDATNGWGLYSSSITCYTGATCVSSPYDATNGPVMAGKQTDEKDYDTQQNLLKEVTWNWGNNTHCPPQGVGGSANAGGGSIDPGGSFMFSPLDTNNPVMVCDPQLVSQDTYTTDGVTNNLSDARVVHTTTAFTYDGNTCGSQGYDYGNVSKQDETANDVGGAHIVTVNTFCPNDNIAGGIFLTSLPAQTQTQNGSGTAYGCSQTYYGGNTSVLTTPSLPGVTRSDAFTSYTGGCTGSAVTTQHSYDSSGNTITGIDPDGHLGCTSGSSQYTACATYDSFGTHLLTATNAKKQVTTYEYDQEAPEAGFGQWLVAETDVNGQTTTYKYDALGRLTAIIRPGDSVSSPTVTYTYNNTCSVGKTTPCLEIDTTTRFTVGGPTSTSKQWYDGWGHVVETQVPGPNLFSKVPAIPSVIVTYTVYDKLGRATITSLPYAVAATAGLGYVAPDLNQPRTVTGYDSLGRSLGTVSYGNATTIVQKSTLSYTIAQGVPTLSSENGNTYEQTITLDAYNHQSISYTDGFGRTRYGQVFTGTASPYTVVRTVGTTYDAVGNKLAVTTFDSSGTTKATYSAAYDGLKRLTGYNDSDLGSCQNTPVPADCSGTTDLAWKYTYDANGNQLSQTDPRNQSTYTSYDALDRPLCRALTSADASSCGGSTDAVFFYDGYSNASTPGAAFPSGCAAPSGNYASDPVGEKTAELFVGTSGSGSGWRCFGYDQRGQTDQSTLSVTTPDAGTRTQTMNTTYNDGGEVTGLVYPDGETLTSTYDVNGRLHSIYFGTSGTSDPVQFLVGQVSYTNMGKIASLALGGSASKASVPTPVLTTANTYDSIQRPLSTSATVVGQTLWRQARTYDNVGNVSGLSTVVPTQSGGSATENESFCYDALNRLAWAGNSGTPTGGDHCMASPTGTTLPAYMQSNSYDSLDRVVNGAAGSYTYGDANQVHAVTGLSNVPNQYAAYDAMGNMTCRNIEPTGGHTCSGSTPSGAVMSYDAHGQLAKWTAPSGTVGNAHYLYDNEGNRVLTNSSNASSTTDTIYFDGYTETVLSGGTTTTTKYYNTNGARIAVRVGGSTLDYLLSDPLGSNSVAFNNQGQVIALQHYSPYGKVDYTWGTMPTSYSYTGQRLDSQTGLLYYNFRYYDPVSGRFVRTDTTQNNAGGMDPYAYVGDNPETRNDPTGQCWPLCTALLGAAIGAVAGGVISYAVQARSGKPINWGAVAGAAAAGALVGGVAGALGPVAITAGAGLAGGASLSAVGTVAAVEATSAVEVGLTASTFVGTIGAGTVGAIGATGGTCSFTASTLVTTGSGKKPIGTLHVRDSVLAYNPKTHKMELQPILHVWVHSDHDLIDVSLDSLPKQKGGKIQKELLHTTSEHPFLTREKGFLPANQLKPGMHVLQANGGYGVVEKQVAVPGIQWMYNLTVAYDHTYVVGTANWIVHNYCFGAGANGRGFEDYELLKEHLKHMPEFNYKTPEDYEDAGLKFVTGAKQDDGTLTGFGVNGDYGRYDPQTNEFAIINKEGILQTYYKPTSPNFEAKFQNQFSFDVSPVDGSAGPPRPYDQYAQSTDNSDNQGGAGGMSQQEFDEWEAFAKEESVWDTEFP
jgi:RHS repeat-associated protein